MCVHTHSLSPYFPALNVCVVFVSSLICVNFELPLVKRELAHHCGVANEWMDVGVCTYIHTITHQLAERPCSWSDPPEANWGSVSCPRTHPHMTRGARN